MPLLLDTHVWIWEVSSTGRLSAPLRHDINEAAKAGHLKIASISIWEIVMLASYRKIQLGRPARLWISEARARSRIGIEPLSFEIAQEAGELPAGFRSDLADLILVATARITGATLVTRDRRILDYAAAGHVNALAA